LCHEGKVSFSENSNECQRQHNYLQTLQSGAQGELEMKLSQTRSAMKGKAFLTVCALILSASLPVFAGQHKMSRDLEGKKASDQST
jgi:hypothetical protein